MHFFKRPVRLLTWTVLHESWYTILISTCQPIRNMCFLLPWWNWHNSRQHNTEKRFFPSHEMFTVRKPQVKVIRYWYMSLYYTHTKTHIIIIIIISIIIFIPHWFSLLGGQGELRYASCVLMYLGVRERAGLKASGPYQYYSTLSRSGANQIFIYHPFYFSGTL